MSEQIKKHLAHDFIFHGVKSVSNASEQITGISNIGYINIKSNTDTMYIGSIGVGSNGYSLEDNSELNMTVSSLDKLYVSGNGSISFVGAYSN